MRTRDSRRSFDPEAWKRAFPRIVVVCGVALLGFYAFAVWAFAAYGGRAIDLGWTLAYQHDDWYAADVDADGPAAGRIVPGDRVVGIRSDAGDVGPLLVADLPPGRPYTVRLVRDGAVTDVVLTRPDAARPELLAGSFVLVAVSFAYFATALLLGLARPELFVARLGAVTFFVAAAQFLVPALDPLRGAFASTAERFVSSAMVLPGPLVFPLVYHFYLRFPRETRAGRMWETLRITLYACGVALVFPNLLLYLSFARAHLFGLAFSLEEPALLFGFVTAYRVFVIFSLVAGAAVLTRNAVLAPSGDERRRLRWVLLAIAGSLVPYAALQVADVASVRMGSPSLVANTRAFPYVAAVSALFGLVPVAFAVTILKHRVFDIQVALRLGVRYLLARGALETVLALPIVVHVARVLTHPNTTIGEMLYGSPLTVVLVVASAASLAIRRRLRRSIDRRFFRGEVDRERVLTGLVDELTREDSISDISRRVSAELDAAFHPSRLAILFRDDGDGALTVAYTDGDPSTAVELSCESSLFRMLEESPRAHEISASESGASDDERRALVDAGFALVIPMVGTDRRPCGMLLLGRKRSEEPYTHRDRTLLQSVAAQMAIVHENARLKSRVALDRKIRVEVLGRVDRDLVNLVKECPRCGACFDSADERCTHDGAELSLSLPVERTVDGKYRLDRLIGRGGMGAVYEGTDLRLSRRVAVKILTGRMFGDSDALRRFEREARASARLAHRNIVRVYDYGTVSDAGAFLVLELLRGRTLRAATIASGGKLATATAAEIFDEVFGGVEAAHDAGVVHRDLKPENIFIEAGAPGEHETVKLLDFGLAKLRDAPVDDTSSLTAPGTVMGTYGYMSPEQLGGGKVDERTDIFALGVIVYEALVGRRPYEARTWVDLIAATTIGDVRVPGSGPDVRRLEAGLKRCLAADPTRRFASVSRARAEIVPLIRACPHIGAPNPAADAAPTKLYGDTSDDRNRAR